jgi:hypothetical protein
MGEPVEGGSGEPLGAEDLDPGLEGQIAGDDQARALIGGGDDVEEQLGADLGGRDVAQLVDLCRHRHRSTYADSATMPTTQPRGPPKPAEGGPLASVSVKGLGIVTALDASS